jgi:hypothetical protein
MRSRGRTIFFIFTLLAAADDFARAQNPPFDRLYFPLNQTTPPGVAGYWKSVYDPPSLGFQPLRVELPTTGDVTVFAGAPMQAVKQSAPAQMSVAVGHTYRLRISHMPEFPGIELFPSIEVLDRLHPPASRADEFPVPIEFTYDEIQFAVEGRLVTKVVYLEQPQLASLDEVQKPLSVLTIPMSRNLLAEADRFGRPLAIIRLGGRLPDAHRPDPAFFGTGGPLMPSVLRQPPKATTPAISE